MALTFADGKTYEDETAYLLGVTEVASATQTDVLDSSDAIRKKRERMDMDQRRFNNEYDSPPAPPVLPGDRGPSGNTLTQTDETQRTQLAAGPSLGVGNKYQKAIFESDIDGMGTPAEQMQNEDQMIRDNLNDPARGEIEFYRGQRLEDERNYPGLGERITQTDETPMGLGTTAMLNRGAENFLEMTQREEPVTVGTVYGLKIQEDIMEDELRNSSGNEDQSAAERFDTPGFRKDTSMLPGERNNPRPGRIPEVSGGGYAPQHIPQQPANMNKPSGQINPTAHEEALLNQAWKALGKKLSKPPLKIVD